MSGTNGNGMASGSGEWRVGVDTGGTFTDVVAVSATGEIRTAKVSSTPPDFDLGIVAGIDELGIEPSHVSAIYHGTTVTTNAAITKSGARTALVTTKGFRDVLELRRGHREDLYDIMWDPPEPLVARADRFEVDERINYRGDVLKELDEDEVISIAEALVARGIEAVAITFLHSYVNDAHEVRAREIIAEHAPGIFISSSADILPEPPEFERTATTVANAYLGPPLVKYLGSLREGLKAAGYTAPLFLMHSGGGVMTVEAATHLPARTAGSGPSAGVVGAAAIGRESGRENLISLDMGGTSCDLAVVVDGEVRRTMRHDLEWGLPVKFPSVDFVAIGSGGGSIKWIDSVGFPRSGPESAGATPGPACYGRGGDRPTTTDANVILNRLSSDTKFGSEAFSIDGQAADDAFGDFARHLEVDTVEAASGAVRIVDNSIASAVRLVTVQKGLDPRDFSMVAFGGAGPLHAVEVAREVGVPEVLIPPNPGLVSALGLHTVDIAHDLTQAFLLRDGKGCEEAEEIYKQLVDEMRERLAEEAGPDAESEVLRQIDLRYTGQAHLMTMTLREGGFDEARLAEAIEDFHAAHEVEYGYSRPEWDVEAAVLRVSGRAAINQVELSEYGRLTSTAEGSSNGDRPEGPATRSLYFSEGGWQDASAYRRSSLRSGDRIEGPAVIEEFNSTTVIPPDVAGTVDEIGNIVIKLEGTDSNE